MTTEFFIKLMQKSVVGIKGPDSINFMQSIMTNDINKVKNAGGIYSVILSAQGKFLVDFFLFLDGDLLLLVCNSNLVDLLLRVLKQYKIRAKVQFADLTTRFDVLWVSERYLSMLENLNCYYARDSRSQLLGSCCLLRSGEFDYKNIPVVSGDDVYEQLRINNMVAEGGKDLLSNVSYPLPYNLYDYGCIDFQKGCYTGQEVLFKLYRRSKVRKVLCKVLLSDYKPPSGSDLLFNNVKVGVMGSHHNETGLALLDINIAEIGRELDRGIQILDIECQQATS